MSGLREILDQVRAREDLKARRVADPVNFVHGFRAPEDQEIVGLIAAVCAFGNVKAIRMKVADLLERVAEVHASPARAGDDPDALHRTLRGWKHRLFRGEDLAAMIIGARAVQREHGTLGRAFAHELAAADSVYPAHHEGFREALATFCNRIRTAGGLPLPGEKSKDGRRGQAHLLPDARAGSAGKRLFLFSGG